MPIKGFDVKSTINDAVGINARQEPSVNVEADVYLQDGTSNIIDYYMPIPKETLELAIVTVPDSYEINIVDASNVDVGDYIVIKKGKRAYQASVLSINTNTLTMDTPVDYAFPLDSSIESRTVELTVDGSITPVIAEFAPPPGLTIDINVLHLSIIADSQMSDNEFGDIPALTRGIVLRQKNGGFITIFNAKTNAQISQRMDIDYSGTFFAGSYGIRGTKHFNSQMGNGVALRLDGDKGECLQLLIQDDLTALSSFQMTVRGHVVEK